MSIIDKPHIAGSWVHVHMRWGNHPHLLRNFTTTAEARLRARLMWLRYYVGEAE